MSQVFVLGRLWTGFSRSFLFYPDLDKLLDDDIGDAVETLCADFGRDHEKTVQESRKQIKQELDDRIRQQRSLFTSPPTRQPVPRNSEEFHLQELYGPDYLIRERSKEERERRALFGPDERSHKRKSSEAQRGYERRVGRPTDTPGVSVARAMKWANPDADHFGPPSPSEPMLVGQYEETVARSMVEVLRERMPLTDLGTELKALRFSVVDEVKDGRRVILKRRRDDVVSEMTSKDPRRRSSIECAVHFLVLQEAGKAMDSLRKPNGESGADPSTSEHFGRGGAADKSASGSHVERWIRAAEATKLANDIARLKKDWQYWRRFCTKYNVSMRPGTKRDGTLTKSRPVVGFISLAVAVYDHADELDPMTPESERKQAVMARLRDRYGLTPDLLEQFRTAE